MRALTIKGRLFSPFGLGYLHPLRSAVILPVSANRLRLFQRHFSSSLDSFVIVDRQLRSYFLTILHRIIIMVIHQRRISLSKDSCHIPLRNTVICQRFLHFGPMKDSCHVTLDLGYPHR